MRTIAKLTLICTAVFLILGSFVGCSSTNTTTANPEVAAIRAYADPATKTTLEGLSENNLARYTQSADSQFKAAVTQDMLDKISSQINSQLGDFVFFTFSRTEKQDPYIIVHYQAKYSKGAVGVRMVFDQDHLVAGQFFE